MIINKQNLATVFQVYSAAFKNAFALVDPMWSKVATMIPSGTESNFYAWLGQFPSLRKWIGERIIKNMVAHTYTLTNDDFESTVGVDRNHFEDDTYGVFSTLFADMGYAAAIHPDELIFEKLSNGATDLCYDGQPFFSASHPVVVNGVTSTVSNYDSTGGGALWALMDTKRPLKPLIWQKRKDYNFQAFNKPDDEHVFKNKEYLYGVDARGAAGYGLWQMAYGSLNTLNATNFDAAWDAMISLKSDEDKPLGVSPNLLVVGPSNRAAARDLIENLYIGGGNSNPNYKAVEVVVSPHLT